MQPEPNAAMPHPQPPNDALPTRAVRPATTHRHKLVAPTLLAIVLATLAGCGPPTDVIDTSTLPAATRDAMLQIQILPLGDPAPQGVGSVGPVAGYGCGATQVDASSAAVQQLQLKAMRLHAVAVTDVLIASANSVPSCYTPFAALAKGTAVAPRGIPPTY
jgi:hypothetical protein